MDRRELMIMLGLAGGFAPSVLRAASRHPAESLYDFKPGGALRVIHTTDIHAQETPRFFREPNINLGIGEMYGRPPHLVGKAMLDYFNIDNDALRYALTYLDFEASTQVFGPMGGMANIASLINDLRGAAGNDNTLCLDGGDLNQGSALSLYTRGRNMIEYANMIGVDAMTGHWEFTYPEEEIWGNVDAFNGAFLAQNVRATEDALFEGVRVHDEDSGHVFEPYRLFERGGQRVAVIGQGFPYTSIANPRRFIPNWSFGIRDGELQELVEQVRADEQPDVVILLSHNGMDVDVKLASVVSGIDFILGGHTHDLTPQPLAVKNSGGQTHVVSGGSHGKFVGVLDIDASNGKVDGFEYRMLPVFADALTPNAEVAAAIQAHRAPHAADLDYEFGEVSETLYRRGNFNGTADQLICEALRAYHDAEISLSPGFRWGATVPAGRKLNYEDLMTWTAMTYPETYRQEMTGEQIKLILEDVADNLFNADPFYQQGGDMVRVSGITFTMDLTQTIGKRIDRLSLSDGSPLDAAKRYSVSGWSVVGDPPDGPPVWECLADFIDGKQEISAGELWQPEIIGADGNPGIAG